MDRLVRVRRGRAVDHEPVSNNAAPLTLYRGAVSADSWNVEDGQASARSRPCGIAWPGSIWGCGIGAPALSGRR